MASFKKNGTIRDFQTFIAEVYARPDNRLYSLENLLSHQERFTMRALKGIRKNNKREIKHNLLVALAWQMAIVNRLHLNLEELVWSRFPYLCSYCGKAPCACKAIKPKGRRRIRANGHKRPKTLRDFQEMFEAIYPTSSRTLEHAGIHLAEETGEVSEAIHNFIGQHKAKQFEEIETELADYTSCLFGVANSANIDIAAGLAQSYKNNCHVCHKCPCACSFGSIAKFRA